MQDLEFEEENIKQIKSFEYNKIKRTSFSLSYLLIRLGVCKDQRSAQSILLVILLINIGVLYYVFFNIFFGAPVKQVPFNELPVEEQHRQSQTDYSSRPEVF